MAWLRETERRRGLKFDMAGFVTAAVAFSCFLVALSNAPTDGWTALYIVVLLMVSVIFFAAWIVVELRVEDPLLDLRLFKDGIFTVGVVVLFVVTTALFGASLLLPLFLQEIRGLGALETGLLLFPQGIAAAVTMPIGGKLFDKIGARPLLIFGLLMLAVATWFYMSLDVTTSDSVIVFALILRGASMGFIFMPLQTAMMNRVPIAKINRGSSLTSAVRQLFASFGVAVVTTVLTSRQSFHQAVIAERVTTGSPMVQQMTAAIGAMAAQHGWTLTQAKSFLLSSMDGQVFQRASVMAYDDAFLFLTIMCIVAILPSLFLGRGRDEEAGQAGEADMSMAMLE
jgi:EmrB/QacA subfamily drug resistance transporter